MKNSVDRKPNKFGWQSQIAALLIGVGMSLPIIVFLHYTSPSAAELRQIRSWMQQRGDTAPEDVLAELRAFKKQILTQTDDRFRGRDAKQAFSEFAEINQLDLPESLKTDDKR